MKKGWAAGAPEFGKLIVPSVAFWAGAGNATSQHTTPSNTEAPAERRRVSIGARQPLNCDLTLTLAMRTSFTTSLHCPQKLRKRAAPCLERRRYHVSLDNERLAFTANPTAARISGAVLEPLRSWEERSFTESARSSPSRKMMTWACQGRRGRARRRSRDRTSERRWNPHGREQRAQGPRRAAGPTRERERFVTKLSQKFDGFGRDAGIRQKPHGSSAQRVNFVPRKGSSVGERLPDIFLFEIRQFLDDLRRRHAVGHKINHVRH